jgi:large subunit ribosomal protein L25
MAEEFVLTAELREDVGKGASRRLRRIADLVPAVIYGAGGGAVSLTIAHKDIHKALENEAFASHVITLKLPGVDEAAILKAVQRHPAKNRILHADFLRVRMDQTITVEVPLHFLNEENCIGVKREGGAIHHLLSSVEITCLPSDLPEFIEVDLTEMHLGDSVHMTDLTLADGLVITVLQQGPEHDQALVSVTISRAETEDEAPAAESESKDDDAAEGEDA